MLLFFSWSIKNQPKIFLDLIFFGSRLFWTKLVFDPTFFTLFKKIGSKEVLSKNVGPQKLRPTNNESKKLPTHHPPGTLVHEMTTWKWWPELSKGSLRIKKCHKKWKKSTIFLTPPPQDVLDFFEFRKNLKTDDPLPSYLIWEKFEIGNNFEFSEPLSIQKT